MCACIEKEVQEFMYGDGENPFEVDGQLNYGRGVERDEFNRFHERPYLDYFEMVSESESE